MKKPTLLLKSNFIDYSLTMNKGYSIKDFIYDFAYIAVLLGLVLFLIGSFPELFNKITHYIFR